MKPNTLSKFDQITISGATSYTTKTNFRTPSVSHSTEAGARAHMEKEGGGCLYAVNETGDVPHSALVGTYTLNRGWNNLVAEPTK
jgi:hypothetical protein